VLSPADALKKKQWNKEAAGEYHWLQQQNQNPEPLAQPLLQLLSEEKLELNNPCVATLQEASMRYVRSKPRK